MRPRCGRFTLIWLTGVTALESVRFLLSIAKSGTEAAVAAIGLHADPAAPNQPENLRRQAIFWLGNSRGRRGFEVISRIVREDLSDKIREHAVFALIQSKEPEALNTLVAVAHDDNGARVRGQALLWLAQRAEQKMAESSIRNAIANDPEAEVKKRAVFALTQMPNGGGVPVDSGGAYQPQSRSAKAGRILAGAEQGHSCAGLYRGRSKIERNSASATDV